MSSIKDIKDTKDTKSIKDTKDTKDKKKVTFKSKEPEDIKLYDSEKKIEDNPLYDGVQYIPHGLKYKKYKKKKKPWISPSRRKRILEKEEESETNGGSCRYNKTIRKRKHKGIIQTGRKMGKLSKGYKYNGKKTKTGLSIIVKVSK